HSRCVTLCHFVILLILCLTEVYADRLELWENKHGCPLIRLSVASNSDLPPPESGVLSSGQPPSLTE
ncbi:hypothetical protein SK128_027562, partial [Halocaridina rubra]